MGKFKKFVASTLIIGSIASALFCAAAPLGRYIAGKKMEEKYAHLGDTSYNQSLVQNPNVEPGYYNEHPIYVCISDKFTKMQRKEVERAVKYVDKVCKGITFNIFVDNIETAKSHIFIVNYLNKENATESNDKIAGSTYRNSPDCLQITAPIYLSEDICFTEIYSIVIHEMGHAIGLKHTSESTDLMFAGGPSLNYKPFYCRGFSKREIEWLNTLYPAAPDKQM